MSLASFLNATDSRLDLWLDLDVFCRLSAFGSPSSGPLWWTVLVQDLFDSTFVEDTILGRLVETLFLHTAMSTQIKSYPQRR